MSVDFLIARTGVAYLNILSLGVLPFSEMQQISQLNGNVRVSNSGWNVLT